MHRIKNNCAQVRQISDLKNGTWFILEKDLNNPDRNLYCVIEHFNTRGVQYICINNRMSCFSSTNPIGNVVPVELISMDTAFNIVRE